MFAAEDRGDVPEGTAREWAHKTKSIKSLPEHVKHKKTASDIASDVVAGCKSWETLKAESKKKTASDITNAVLATDGRSSRVLHDFYEGGKWAPGGIEYHGPMKIAAELPTNVVGRVPSAIGSIIGAPKPKLPKLPESPKPPKPPKAPKLPKPPKPPKYNKKKTAAEIADMVMRKVATYED
jgi:hypothetical protein